MNRLLKMLLMLIFFGGFIMVQNIHAQQQTDSNIVRTIVGNPQPSDGILAVGQGIKSAYDACSNGDTHEPPASLSCLQNELRRQGLSEAQIDTFSQDYSGRKVGSPNGRGVRCIQCLGFVGLVLSTYSETIEALQLGRAKDVINVQSFSSGNITFQKLPLGTPPQPGDIGVHEQGSDGHIVIVTEQLGNVRFRALESNGQADCRITDNRDILIDQYGYIFFRQQ